jgi:hypothetical protein
MNPRRYLCSQLVTLRNNSGESAVHLVANLEEIWATGAVLESEQPVKEDTNMEMRCGSALFAGRVVQVEQHEFGWRVQVEFSPLTPWSLEKFEPEHLLNASELDKSDVGNAG